MSIEQILLIIGAALIDIYIATYSLYWFIKSTIFYYRHDWDFSIDYGPPIYKSEFQTSTEEVKGKMKYFVFLPILVVVSISVGIPLFFIAIPEVING